MNACKRIAIILLSFVMFVTYMPAMAFADDGDIASGTYGTCNWDIDSNGVLTIHEGELDYDDFSLPWASYRSQITSVKTDGNVKALNCDSMFYNCYNLKSVDLTGMDTSEATSMGLMFWNCGSIEELDLSNFDTSKVTDMNRMFYCCDKLTKLDVSNFDTSKVTTMEGMFSTNGYDDPLTELDLSSFDTSNVTTMEEMFEYRVSLQSIKIDKKKFNTGKVTNFSHMFYNCNSLSSFDVSGFDTSSATDMSDMFCVCESLTTLDVSGFDTSSATDMSDMFCVCESLTTLDVSGFNTSNVTDMSGMFASCEKLTTLDVSGFNTSNVTNMEYMFDSCSSLTTLDVSGFDTSNVTNMVGMFTSCSSLSTLDVSNFDTSNVTTMEYMFYESGLTTLNLSGFDTSKVTNMEYMFADCDSLTTLDVSGFDTSNVTGMSCMFSSCSSLTTLDVSGFDTSNVTEMNSMFSGCSSLTTLDVSGFNTPSLTDMSRMFSECNKLTSLDLSKFDTSKVEAMDELFYECSSLKNLNISSFDTSNVTTMRGMFCDCYNLTELDLSNFNTSNVTDMQKMFMCCYALESVNVSSFDTFNVTDMLGLFYYCSSLTELDLSSFDTTSAVDLDDMFNGCSSLNKITTGNWIYNDTLKDRGYYPTFPARMKDTSTGTIYQADSSLPELSHHTYVMTEDGAQYRQEPEKQITEADLYTPQYSIYLLTSYHDKITNRLYGDMAAINAERSALDNAYACLISNMKQDAGVSVINSIISAVTGEYYKQDELEEDIALGYLQAMANDQNIVEEIVNAANKEFKLTKNAYTIIESGYRNAAEKKALAEALACDVYDESEALEIIRNTEDNWTKIDKIFKNAGATLNVAEVAATIIITAQTNSETTTMLRRLVEKDSNLYRGLTRIRSKQKYPAEKIVEKLIVDKGFDEIASFMTDQGIGRLASLFAGTGGIKVGMATAIASIGYYALGSILDKFSGNSDEVVTSIISVANQCELYRAIINMRTDIRNSSDPSALRDDYVLLYSAYMTAIDQGVSDVLKVAKSGNAKEKLKSDYDKYKSQLTYEKYIKCCLANANAVIDYYIDDGKACISAYNRPSTTKSVTKSSGATLTKQETEASSDVVYIDVPETLGKYTVAAIGESAFTGDETIAGVYVPGDVTAIGANAFEGCTNLTDVLLEDGVTDIGDSAFSNCTSLDSVVLPDTVENLGSSVFSGIDSVTVSAKNTDVIDKYIESTEDNVTSDKLEPELTSISIATPASKLSYTMSEIADPDEEAVTDGKYSAADLTGMTLTATYDDGTEETITEDFVGYFEDKKEGDCNIIVCYGDQSTSYTVNVTNDECTYEIAYVDAWGTELAERTTGTATAGSSITVEGKSIEGYTVVSESRSETIGADNYFEVVYEEVKKPSVADATITLSETAVEYTGQEIKPEVVVNLDDTVLTAGTDYTLTYYDNTEIGDAAVVVEGIGEYSGIAIEVFEITKVSIESAQVSGISTKTYTGKALTQNPVVELNGVTLTKTTDYTVEYINNVNAGTANVIITGTGQYDGTITQTFTIKKAANPLTIKAKTAKVKFKTLKKKNQTLSVLKVINFSKKGQGKVTYKLVSVTKAKFKKFFKIDSKTGKVTIKKKLKKGTYKVKVAVTAAGNANYNKATKTVTFKIKVK